MICLDFGQGDSTKNDPTYIKNLMDTVPQGVVIKFQLFVNHPVLTALKPSVFYQAWVHGQQTGKPVTASVFDEASINVMRQVQVPFYKIASHEKWYPLIDKCPDYAPIIVSVDSHVRMLQLATENMTKHMAFMCCVSEYPAEMEEYERLFTPMMLAQGISDHTTSTELYEKYRPILWERHYGDRGPDAEHAITREELLRVMDGS